MRNDPEARLPEDARLKFAMLVAESEEAATLAAMTKKRIDGLNDRLHETDNQAVLDSTQAELTRQKAVMAGHQQRHRAAAGLVAQLRGWVTAVPTHSRLVMVPAVKLKRSASIDDLVKDIADVRERIVAVKQERRTIKSAPPPKAVLIKQAGEAVEALAKRGAPTIRASGNGLAISFTDPNAYTALNSERVAAMMAWLDPEGMNAKLVKAIDELPEATTGLPPKERADRLAALEDELDHLERREEALIVAALCRGQVVSRRADASPAAILGVVRQDANAAAA